MVSFENATHRLWALVKTYKMSARFYALLLGMTLTACTAQVNQPGGATLTDARLVFSTSDSVADVETEFDFDRVVAPGGTGLQIITVINVGEKPASGLGLTDPSAPFAWEGGTYPGTSGTCASTLAGGTSCTLAIVFNPTAIGPFAETLIATFGSGTGSFIIRGRGDVPAVLTVSDSPLYDYGIRSVGSLTLKIFTITNTGGVTATGLAETGLTANTAHQVAKKQSFE